MNRRRSRSSFERRLDALESDANAADEPGWFDVMNYAHIRAEHGEDAPSWKEYYGAEWVEPDWYATLRARQRENDRRRENGEL